MHTLKSERGMQVLTETFNGDVVGRHGHQHEVIKANIPKERERERGQEVYKHHFLLQTW